MVHLRKHRCISWAIAMLTILAGTSGVLWVMIEGGGLFIRYFTIQSNILVVAVSIWFLINHKSKIFIYIATIALLNIVVTAVVFHLLLYQFGLTFKNHLSHTFSPIFYVLLYYGCMPSRIRIKEVWILWLYPSAYFVFFLLTGLMTSFYPYPFMDVDALGIMRVLITGFGFLLPAIVVVSYGLVFGKKILEDRVYVLEK